MEGQEKQEPRFSRSMEALEAGSGPFLKSSR